MEEREERPFVVSDSQEWSVIVVCGMVWQELGDYDRFFGLK